MLAKVCMIIFCAMGLLMPALMIIDFKRAAKGKKAVLFELDDGSED